jgi:hypothetical protein
MCVGHIYVVAPNNNFSRFMTCLEFCIDVVPLFIKSDECDDENAMKENQCTTYCRSKNIISVRKEREVAGILWVCFNYILSKNE